MEYIYMTYVSDMIIDYSRVCSTMDATKTAMIKGKRGKPPYSCTSENYIEHMYST